MPEPLDGVHVLDVSEFGFVPTAAAVLGDWGADVVKVERPGGDPLRSHTMVDGTAEFNVLIEHFNRNKRGIVLDIGRLEGRTVFDRLLSWADVLVTNFLPRTIEKLNLTPEAIHAVNPRVVYVRGTGQGSKGPDRELPGFDGVTWWARGAIAHSLSPPGVFARMRPALGDGPTGMMLAGGVAAALYQREKTGHGTVVESSLLQGAMWTLAPDLTTTSLLGREPSRATPSSVGPLLGAYVTKDQRWLNLTMPDFRWWKPACRALGLEALLADARYTTVEGIRDHAQQLRVLFEEAISSRPLSELCESLLANECVFGKVATIEDLLGDAQVEANGFMPQHPVHASAKVVASPVQFGQEPISIRRGAPRVGEHTTEFLSEVGLSQEDIKQLLASGIAGQG
jgi:crotonobetainyl-CoA:carnitine CoA-transferase CaiB-like acyl-CoA transferase